MSINIKISFGVYFATETRKSRALNLLIFPTVIYMILLYYIHSSVCPTQECKGDCYTSRKKGKESISGYITLSMLYKEYIYYL